jgi:hypothetical protein
MYDKTKEVIYGALTEVPRPNYQIKLALQRSWFKPRVQTNSTKFWGTYSVASCEAQMSKP